MIVLYRNSKTTIEMFRVSRSHSDSIVAISLFFSDTEDELEEYIAEDRETEGNYTRALILQVTTLMIHRYV